MESKTAYEKSKGFAVRIINLTKYLAETKQEYIISKQLLRAGTSIGANLAEANCAASKKDFLNKTYIAYKECSETIYWLEILAQTGYLTEAQFRSVMGDCRELFSMLSSTTKTTRESLSIDEDPL